MKSVYFNRVQQRALLIGAKVTVVVAGRRTGKTFGLAAPYMLRNVQRMPGGTGGIVVPTFKHGLTNTLPGLFTGLKRLGWREGLHYVVGHKPPKTFKEAIIEPREYEHVISFYNGSRAVLISQDRPGTSNSLTLDWLLIDEARFIDFQQLKDEAFPANGGTKLYFGSHACHHSIMILSDMPQTQKGSWFLHYREQMDTEVIEAIETLIIDLQNMRKRARAYIDKGEAVPKQLTYQIHSTDRRLNQLRSVAVYYAEWSTIENIEVVGEEYILQMKRDLTPLTFRTSILGQRVGQDMSGFYNSMTDRHTYNATNFEYLDSLGYIHSEAEFNRLVDSNADADLRPNDPICIGMDYNANINWIVAGQPDWENRRLNVLKSFYVKFNRKLPELVADFCEYYKQHPNKTVIFYHDATAIGNNYAVNNKDFRYVITQAFVRHNWRVIPVYLGSPMAHPEKYTLINEGFAGRGVLEPFFNEQNNEDLLLAIRTAGVLRGSKGFRKNKSGEKLAETEEDLLEHRTDGTDAFDTLFIGCATKPQRVIHSVSITGVVK